MGSINSETPYLHQIKWRGTSYILTKRSTWNMYIFRYTFHDNPPPPNRRVERGDGGYVLYIDNRGTGREY